MSKRYSLILADPPWVYPNPLDETRKLPYSTLTTEDIAALPVDKIAADNSYLFLWGTWPRLKDTIYVLESWGFEYKTLGFVWVKRNKIKDSWFWGMGQNTRSGSEFCLFGSRNLTKAGKIKRLSASVHSTLDDRILPHSEKPAHVRDKIVELYGDLPRVELFARQVVPGWDAIGYDIDGRDIRDVAKEW